MTSSAPVVSVRIYHYGGSTELREQRDAPYTLDCGARTSAVRAPYEKVQLVNTAKPRSPIAARRAAEQGHNSARPAAIVAGNRRRRDGQGTARTPNSTRANVLQFTQDGSSRQARSRATRPSAPVLGAVRDVAEHRRQRSACEVPNQTDRAGVRLGNEDVAVRYRNRSSERGIRSVAHRRRGQRNVAQIFPEGSADGAAHHRLRTARAVLGSGTVSCAEPGRSTIRSNLGAHDR